MPRSTGLLSMSELARRLELPESTLRYYCKHFSAFLPYIGEGRRRRYVPEALPVLEFISEAMRRNKNATAVELMLKAGYHKAERYRIPDETTHTVNALEAAIPLIPRKNATQTEAASDYTDSTPASNAHGLAHNEVAAPVDDTAERNALTHLLAIFERQSSALSSMATSLEALSTKLCAPEATAPAVAQFTQTELAESIDMPQTSTTGATLPQSDAGEQNVRIELEALRGQIHTAEKMHQEDLEQIRKWLTRLNETVAGLSR